MIHLYTNISMANWSFKHFKRFYRKLIIYSAMENNTTFSNNFFGFGEYSRPIAGSTRVCIYVSPFKLVIIFMQLQLWLHACKLHIECYCSKSKLVHDLVRNEVFKWVHASTWVLLLSFKNLGGPHDRETLRVRHETWMMPHHLIADNPKCNGRF